MGYVFIASVSFHVYILTALYSEIVCALKSASVFLDIFPVFHFKHFGAEEWYCVC